MRHSVDFLYSLYDALVSINVPSDKARAVVDAMERDMATTLATKQDLRLLEQQIAGLRGEVGQQIAGLRTELRQEIENRHALLTQEIATLRAGVAKDIEAMGLRLTVRLGTIVGGVATLIIAVMVGGFGWLASAGS